MPFDGLPAAELDDLFGSLANELRIAILQELWKRYGEPLSFTDLQSRVGVRDSGRFNYHLNELVPEFVRKTEEGYVLTHTGRQTVGAAVSGRFTADGVEVESVRAVRVYGYPWLPSNAPTPGGSGGLPVGGVVLNQQSGDGHPRRWLRLALSHPDLSERLIQYPAKPAGSRCRHHRSK